MSDQYKTAAQNFIEKGLNQKDLSVLETYFSPDLIDHALPPGLPSNLEGRKIFASALLAAFSDIHVKVKDLIAEGEKLVTRYSVHGTHKGDLMGILPSGKEVSITGVAIDRFENGLSVEHWEITDQIGMLQTGAIPT